MSISKNGLSASQVFLPLSLLALVVFLGTAFQTVQSFRDRAVLHQAKAQQDKPLEDARRVQAQLDALAVGTLKLADEGDKNAQNIIDRLKALGITVTPPKAGTTVPTSMNSLPSSPDQAVLPSAMKP